jgi:uncharacterized protein YejL (UPF0352 family)
MPVQSQYDDESYNQLLQKIVACLDEHQASTDLALMVLGDTLTHVFNERVDAQHRQQIASQFCDVLKRTIKE